MGNCFVKLADVKKILCDSCQEECEKTTCDYQAVLSELREKAVDAESVRHGHWIELFGDTYRCSVCKELRSSRYCDTKTWKYCPCGAKMDGDVTPNE